MGASDFRRTITTAFSFKFGGLEKTRLGYDKHGGDAECYRWNNVLFVTATHARGAMFFVYLIDEDDSLLRVYGITGGNPGWTETYGWLMKGTWVTPILAYLRSLDRDITAHRERLAESARIKQAELNRRIEEKVARFNAMFREYSEVTEVIFANSEAQAYEWARATYGPSAYTMQNAQARDITWE